MASDRERSSLAKARAWERAALILEAYSAHEPTAEKNHIRSVIAPSLKRRAEIIRRNRTRGV